MTETATHWLLKELADALRSLYEEHKDAGSQGTVNAEWALAKYDRFIDEEEDHA